MGGESVTSYNQRVEKAITHLQQELPSFAIMEQWRITEGFTFDRHFKQVGFLTLPRQK